jgi:N-methylhydantoinase A
MLDVQTVGAGGGSIARVDEGGLLRVGPESAGADPGPACYGEGTAATVTDAHVVLGRILPEHFLGGTMALRRERAEEAVDQIANKLRVSRTNAALGILRIANANMERVIRAVSIERGYDAREFALVAFGGCGGLHACEIAEELGITTVLVPGYAGVLSALGMLMADRVRDYAAGVLGCRDIEHAFQVLEKRARSEMGRVRLQRFTDMRYAGQSYEITIRYGASFHDAHRKLYGYSDPGREVETVTVRVRAVQPVPRLKIAGAQASKRSPKSGPAIVPSYGSTTYVPPGWKYDENAVGCLVIRR